MLRDLRPAALCIVLTFFGIAAAPAASQQERNEDAKATRDNAPVVTKPLVPSRLYRHAPAQQATRYQTPRYQTPRYIARYRYRPGYDNLRYGSTLRFRDDEPYAHDAYADAIEQAYQQGLADGRDEERFQIQAERGHAGYQNAMAAGHAEFRTGHYGSAARNFVFAATLDQGDPTSRLCTAHTQVALGEYESAAKLVRRALSLQPRLLFLSLKIRSAYGMPADFDAHFATLREAAEADPQQAGRWLLVGYYYYFSGDVPSAKTALARAVELSGGDRQIKRFYELTRMTADTPVEKAPVEKAPLEKAAVRTGKGI